MNVPPCDSGRLLHYGISFLKNSISFSSITLYSTVHAEYSLTRRRVMGLVYAHKKKRTGSLGANNFDWCIIPRVQERERRRVTAYVLGIAFEMNINILYIDLPYCTACNCNRYFYVASFGRFLLTIKSGVLIWKFKGFFLFRKEKSHFTFYFEVPSFSFSPPMVYTPGARRASSLPIRTVV